MAEVKRGTATGPQRAELRLLLKRLDAETQDDVFLDVNPDEPDLSAEDAAGGIGLLRRLVDEHEKEKAKEEARRKDRLGCLGIAVLLLLVVGWCSG